MGNLLSNRQKQEFVLKVPTIHGDIAFVLLENAMPISIPTENDLYLLFVANELTYEEILLIKNYTEILGPLINRMNKRLRPKTLSKLQRILSRKFDKLYIGPRIMDEPDSRLDFDEPD